MKFLHKVLFATTVILMIGRIGIAEGDNEYNYLLPKANIKTEEIIEEKEIVTPKVYKVDMDDEVESQSYQWNFKIGNYDRTLYFNTEEEMNTAKNILNGCQLIVSDYSYHIILANGEDIRIGNEENIIPTVFEIINY